MKTENLKSNDHESLKEKFKKSMKVNIFQLSLAGILLCIGVISEAYIKIGNTTFLSFGIYLTLGLILPLWLGASTGVLIDLLYLLINGQIGSWYWTMGLEKIIIVTVGWSLQFLYSLIKSRKITIAISISLLIIILVGGTIAFLTKDGLLNTQHNLVWNKHEHKMLYETEEQFLERWLKNGFSFAGILFISIFMIWHIYYYIKGTKKGEYLATMIISIIAALIVYWMYHPWNVAMWYKYYLNIDWWEHYDALQISGIIRSMFSIGLAIPIVTMFWTIYKSSTYFKNKNRF